VYLPKIQDAFRKKEKTDDIPAPAVRSRGPSALTPVKDEEPMDDLALIAVITAAIAASAGVSEDSFVVRSIRRSPANHWNKTI
jgi:hypothetical protein